MGTAPRRKLSYSGYVGLNSHLAFEPAMALAWVDLPYGEFTARVLSVRTIVTPNPRMVLSGLMQFNAANHSLSSSARLRWEYRPGSELFVVYSDGRDTLTRGDARRHQSIVRDQDDPAHSLLTSFPRGFTSHGAGRKMFLYASLGGSHDSPRRAALGPGGNTRRGRTTTYRHSRFLLGG